MVNKTEVVKRCTEQTEEDVHNSRLRYDSKLKLILERVS